MTPALRTLVWGSVTAAIIGFYLPWAELWHESKVEKEFSARARSSLSKTFNLKPTPSRSWFGKPKPAPLIPTKVSGAQIPVLANRKNVKVVMQLVKLFTKQTDQQTGPKSYAVYLAPGIALLCGVLVTIWGGTAPVAIGVGICCAALSAAGFWTLLTTNPKAAYGIAIGPGLWLSLAAYGVLGLAALALASQQLRHRLER